MTPDDGQSRIGRLRESAPNILPLARQHVEQLDDVPAMVSGQWSDKTVIWLRPTLVETDPPF